MIRHSVSVLIIVSLCVIAYSGTFDAPFHFDDGMVIVNNPLIRDLGNFTDPSLMRRDNRYIGYLTFALNYKVHGLEATGYHVVNLLIHILNSLLIYLLVVQTFGVPRLRKSSLSEQGRYMALICSLLFAVHPLQTEAVTYIWQRVACLATMFCLISLVAYVQFRTRKTKAAGILFYSIALISAVLAMKSKEIAFTLPLVIVLYEGVFLDGKTGRRIFMLIPFILTMLIIPLAITGVDKPLGDIIGDVGELTRLHTDMSRTDYLLTQFTVIVTYLRLIFLPVNQNLDYDYAVYTSFFQSAVFLSFTLLLCIVLISMYAFLRFGRTSPETRIFSFGLFWFFITLSVESSVIPIVDVIFEHRMYLPSIGLFMAVTVVVFMAMQRWRGLKKVMTGVLFIIIITLSGVTYARNSVWKDEVSLWQDVVRKSPKKSRSHFSLGYAYNSRHFIEKAIQHYQKALALNPSYGAAYYNLGNAYIDQGLTDRAIKQYRLAIDLIPGHSDVYINLGNAYLSKGLFDKAIQQYKTALKLSPDDDSIYHNLGSAYEAKGLTREAHEYYRIARRLNPERYE